MSKITRPILTEVLPRKLLFSLLDRMRRRPIIWVSGPAGCGKTTVISSYIQTRKIPCLWYQVDEGDADPATFFYYMGQAAKRASPRFRKPLPLLTPEYLQGIPAFTLRYFENLFDRLKIPSMLVFDNYQEVPSESPFHEIILNGLSGIPEGVNVILISRTEPPPAFIRLRANNLMSNLGWDELRLNPGESRSIITSKTRQKLSRETIQHLHNTTDGWAAGLILMLESMKRGIKPQMLGKLTPDEIFDYFGKELFDKTDKEIQEFFLKTAFLPKMTAKMAEALTDIPHAGRILSALSRNNYFTERRFHKEPIYQYHPLYRDFLLSHAKEAFSQAALTALLRQAAKLLEDDGQTESALSLLHEANDWNEMVTIIMKHASLMIAHGRYRPLEDWLNSLPMENLENNPWLLYWMGECRFPFNPSVSRSFFEKAFEEFKIQKETTGMFLAWSALVYSIWLEAKDFSLFDHWIHVFQELMRDVKKFPSEEIGTRVASNMVSILITRQPWHPEIDAWAQQALFLAETCSNVYVKMNAFYQVAFYRVYTGQLGMALHPINLLRQLSRSQKVPPLTLLLQKCVETIYYRFLGMHEEVLRTVPEAMEISRKTGIRGFDYLLGHGAASALNVQDFKGTEEFLVKLDSSLEGLRKWNQYLYHLVRAKEALFRGDTRKASLFVDTALKLVTEVGSPLSLVFAQVAKAHVMHELGKHKEASDYLSQAADIAYPAKNKLQIFHILLARARFGFDEGNEASGISFLREALAMGREDGIIDTFIDHPATMSMLCARALEAGIEVEYVKEIIEKRRLTPEKPHLHLENWPWPLKIFTLGRFELIKDGRPIRFSRKAQQRPLSVLKVIIAFGGKEVREDQIMDALWPEADGDLAQQSFSTTLHRLRQLLGYEGAIQRQEGKLTLNDRFCWVDTWAFESIVGQADKQFKYQRVESAFQLIEKAIGIYKGPFLAKEIGQSWTISMSERLRNKFLRNVGKLGQYYQDSGQWEKALDCYLRGLEVDDLAEEFYSGLMFCYHRLGRKTDALAVYNRYKKTLSSLPGIEPSAKIEALYRNLTKNV